MLPSSVINHKVAGFKQCTKQGMTARASNWSQKYWRRRPHFTIGLLL